MVHRLATLPVLFALASPGTAQERPIDQLFPGTLLVCGGGAVPDSVREAFVRAAGGQNARIVVIPTPFFPKADGDTSVGPNAVLAPWKKLPHASLVRFHTRSRKEADREDFVAPLQKATGIWLSGGVQSRLAIVYRGTRVEQELRALLQRGGVVGGTSAEVWVAGTKDKPKIPTGFDLLPGAIFDQHFSQRSRLGRLQQAVQKHPARVGFGIDEGTALMVRGRLLSVLGNGSVTMCLAGSKHRKPRTAVWRSSRRNYDLVTWRRAALVRAGKDFAFEPARTEVPNGTVILIGGGGVTQEVLSTFVESAGGINKNFLVVPTAMGRPRRGDTFGTGYLGRVLSRLGAKNIDVLHATAKTDVEKKANLDKIRKANAIWFDGGRQWRLVDAYEGTKALALFHGVLARGGVIAGSSAGCSIQAGFMVRGNPLGNREIGMEGYERGFAFLPGVAADQHFAQRNRFRDMELLMRRYPKVLGLGIDESTAIVARGTKFTVIGPGKVAVFSGSSKYVRHPAGTVYDMLKRKVVTARRGIR